MREFLVKSKSSEYMPNVHTFGLQGAHAVFKCDMVEQRYPCNTIYSETRCLTIHSKSSLKAQCMLKELL